MSDHINYTISDIKKFWNLINLYRNILILGPKNIDGDTIGANIVLEMFLTEQMKKNVILYSSEQIDSKYQFLPGIHKFIDKFEIKDFDFVISTDVADPKLFADNEYVRSVWESGMEFVNIDHHISNKMYGSLNIVDSKCSSSTMLVYNLLRKFHGKLNKDMATLLLMGLYFDTGILQHPNTTAETYEIASELLRCGADFKAVIKNLFQRKSFAQLKLWGLVLSRMTLNKEGILISAITMEDLENTGATREELEGVIDFLNHVVEKRFCLLLSEDGKGNVKGSLRTQDPNVDVNEVANEFGGGGHRGAAGFTLPGKRLEKEIRWVVKS